MLIVKNLVKNYGKHEALKGISFHIEEGQIVGLLGPNGAGKSTTMNIVTGYLAPTSGEIKIHGIDLLEKPKKARSELGYLPEQPPLYTDMTVEEYLKFVCCLKGSKNTHTAADETEKLMQQTNLVEYRNVIIKQLSKGYRQRVGLAQALAGNPPLLILDEPMVGLDPNQIIEMRELIRSLAGEHTIIISSHILSEIESVCDHILILNQGQVMAESETRKLEDENTDAGHLRMVLKGDKAEISRILRSTELLKEIQSIKETESGVYEVRALAETGNEDVRDALFVLLAQNQIVVYSLNIEHLSLEDIFIKLTGKEEENESNL